MAVARNALLSVACLLVLSTATSGAAVPDSRILGGEDAVTGQHSWVTSVRVNNAHACVGSIIGEKYVLTAAQCVSKLGATPVESNQVTVRSGSINQFAGGKISNVQAINIHPSYGNFLHDIAVLTLSEPLVFNDKTQKITIAEEDDEIEKDTLVTVSGWGLQLSGASPYKLQQATYSVLSTEDCEYEASYGYESALCLKHAEQEGICRGDHGAGVVAGEKLIGTVSFAFGSCGTKYPDVACRVSYYSDWINSVTA